MEVVEAFALGTTVGVVAAVTTVGLAWLLLRRHTRVASRTGSATPGVDPTPALPEPVTSEDLARRGLDVLRAGVMLLDPDDYVLFANPSVDRLGLTREVAGRTGIGHPVLRSLAGRARRSGHARDVRLELRRAAAEPLGVRVRVVPLGTGHVAIEVEDISEAQRVARARRDLVANLSHELKTPVGALGLLAEALLDASDELGDTETTELRRFAARILHESTRLSRLVTELLELSRLEGGEPLPDPERVAVDRILHEVLDRSRTAAAAKEIDVRLDGGRGLLIHGHERLLVTAVANLVDNAIAYSPERTTVTISTRRDGAHIEISVTDEGIGIAAEDQNRIFERFYRVDRARSRATGGTGLGLAIVKHVATNHGGQVSVHSALGKGSRFTLRLPAGSSTGARQTPGTTAQQTGKTTDPLTTVRT